MDDEHKGRSPDDAVDEPVWELEQLLEEPRPDFQDQVARSVRRHVLIADVMAFAWAGASHALAVLLGTMWRATGNIFTGKEDRDA